MENMKSSDLMVKCLENEDVEYIFGLPGEENIELMESLSNSKKIKFITTRHEQGAAFMADVYGRIKHKPGVCLATLGPGALNLATGVASANLDHSPLVAITGQADFSEIHHEQHQYIDVVRTFKPITKWNTRVSSADSVPEIVRKAFRISSTEKYGATHIELPDDIAGQETMASPMKIVNIPQTLAKQEDIDKASEIINKAKYPAILCGNGIVRTQQTEELVEFAEKANIPVAKTFMSKGTIPGNHALSFGTIGLQTSDCILEEFKKADLIIAVGYDLVEYSPVFWNPDRDKKIIRIGSIPEEYVDSYYGFEVELIGDMGQTLRKLGSKVKKRESRNLDHLKRGVKKEREQFTPTFPIKPQHVLKALREAMNDDDILVSDVGSHKIWISRLFPTYKPNKVIISNGLASMGIALPGAIGAKLAMPEANVFSANGDGGFLMNVQELETAKRLGIGLVTVIFNDNSYGMIEWKQRSKEKHVFGVKLGNPDFVKLAQSFGAKGYKIERASEVEEIVKNAAKSGELAVIEIPVDYSENQKIGMCER
ncbi:acetolactate synthase large subunit [Candidatus Micrarchaeota archaeon]|nr:acetolactate synthase large subunit [Candidatus Micrarchaeota archaeon]